MNQPGIQNWLQEMKDESLSQYDIMTVGEANGVNPDNAEEWVGEDKGKFNMIFQFEHLGLWSTGDSQFDVKSYKGVKPLAKETRRNWLECTFHRKP